MSKPAIESGDLRVVFSWCGDRYGHRIELRTAGQWQTALESVEGAPEDPWPPSPALQNLHIEQRGSGAVALLVGKAGASHWSASIEPMESQSAIQFDVACRVKHSPQQIGNVYKQAVGPTQPTVRIAALPPNANCLCSPGDTPTAWRVRPVELAAKYPATIRWRYMFRLKETST